MAGDALPPFPPPGTDASAAFRDFVQNHILAGETLSPEADFSDLISKHAARLQSETETSPEYRAQKQSEADALVPSLLQNYLLLGQLLDRHEAVIRKRWLGKTREKRLRLLLEAWPVEMPGTHRPEMRHYINRELRTQQQDANRRLACLCPAINQEDLCKPKNLLMLLNSRGRTNPSRFVDSDSEAMYVGRQVPGIGETLHPFTMIIMHDATQPRKYGEIVNIGDLTELEQARGLNVSSAGPGLLVLEAQQTILAFLVDCIKLIMHEFTLEKLLDFPVLDALEQIPPSADSNSPSVSAMAHESPYRSPEEPDFAHLEAVLAARAAAAEVGRPNSTNFLN